MDEKEPLVPKQDAETKLRELTTKYNREIKKRETLSQVVDGLRQVITVGTLVVVMLLLIGAFVDHPIVSFQHRIYATIALACVCFGFALSLWLSKGHPTLMLILMMLGTAVFWFSLGYGIGRIQALLSPP